MLSPVRSARDLNLNQLQNMQMESDNSVQARSALLIIDMQIGLIKLMPAEVQANVLPKIKAILTKVRSAAIPVIHIQHDGPKGHPLETTRKPGKFMHAPSSCRYISLMQSSGRSWRWLNVSAVRPCRRFAATRVSGTPHHRIKSRGMDRRQR